MRIFQPDPSRWTVPLFNDSFREICENRAKAGIVERYHYSSLLGTVKKEINWNSIDVWLEVPFFVVAAATMCTQMFGPFLFISCN